jgi:hypothetical protein
MIVWKQVHNYKLVRQWKLVDITCRLLIFAYLWGLILFTWLAPHWDEALGNDITRWHELKEACIKDTWGTTRIRNVRGAPTTPKVSLWSVERIGRSIAWSFEFFPAGCVLPDCPGKTGLTGFPNRSDRFSPLGCREGFLSKGVSVVIWLLLFKGGKALEVFWVSGSFWGVSGQNRPDQFATPIWLVSPACVRLSPISAVVGSSHIEGGWIWDFFCKLYWKVKTLTYQLVLPILKGFFPTTRAHYHKFP